LCRRLAAGLGQHCVGSRLCGARPGGAISSPFASPCVEIYIAMSSRDTNHTLYVAEPDQSNIQSREYLGVAQTVHYQITRAHKHHTYYMRPCSMNASQLIHRKATQVQIREHRRNHYAQPYKFNIRFFYNVYQLINHAREGVRHKLVVKLKRIWRRC
jgi:hypothetical protein